MECVKDLCRANFDEYMTDVLIAKSRPGISKSAADSGLTNAIFIF